MCPIDSPAPTDEDLKDASNLWDKLVDGFRHDHIEVETIATIAVALAARERKGRDEGLEEAAKKIEQTLYADGESYYAYEAEHCRADAAGLVRSLKSQPRPGAEGKEDTNNE